MRAHTINCVEEGGLAEGLLVLGCGVADVVTGLLATDEVRVGIYSLGLREYDNLV